MKLQIALLVSFTPTYFPHLTPAICVGSYTVKFMIPETVEIEVSSVAHNELMIKGINSDLTMRSL